MDTCSRCTHWEKIDKEGAPGMPQKIARPGWGLCTYSNLTLVRIKGFLETNEHFGCIAFREKG